MEGDIKTQALALLSNGIVPQLIVLDLDYTIWRCFIDSLGGPPFKYCEKTGMVLDRRNWEVEFFPHIKPLFHAFQQANVKIALASRTEEPTWAEDVIHIFKVDDKNSIVDFTHAREIYPTSKEKHFRELARKMQVDFHNMLFFDDEKRNIHEVSRLGVTAIHCEDGLSLEALEAGLKKFRDRDQHRQQR